MFLDNFINSWNSQHNGGWRDYFIPHAGNDYRPHSLHPKRLAFHAVSLIAIKAVVVVFAVFFPLSAWLSPDIIMVQSHKIISLTNDVRKNLHLNLLTENQRLDQAAYAKAQDMLLNQYFAHIGPQNRGLDFWLSQAGYKYAVAGENLAMGFSSPEEVIVAWENSPTHYANMIDPDFSEIGVSMSEGNFNGTETTLVTQYFGAPESAVYSLAAVPATIVKTAKPASAEKKSVINSKKIVNPVLAPAKTSVVINKTPNQKEQVVKVDTYLATGTAAAEVVLGETQIALQRSSADSSRWTGQALIPAENDDSAPITPVSLVATNTSGLTTVSDINEQNIQPRQVSPLEQYFFFKNNPNKTLETIFNISSIYFKIILLLAVISLLLNIFIEIKKQHPHLIVNGLGLVALLIVLIKF